MTTEMVKSEKMEVAQLPIQGMNDLIVLGDFIAQSGMIGVSSPAAGLVVATECHQKGMTILDFSRRYHVDNRGKVTMRSDRMLAEFMELGGVCKWESSCDDKVEQKALFTYGVNKNYPVTFKYQEAVDGGYIKKGSNWEKDPAAQMRARVISRGIRMVCPGAIAGMYDPNEMHDVYENETPRSSEPTPVSEEVMEEIKTATTAKTEVTFESNDDVDYSICPIKNCEFTGKRWADLGDEDLTQALTLQSMGVTEGHCAEINKELNKRKSK